MATKYGIISKGHVIKEITAEELHDECKGSVVIRAEDPTALDSLLRTLLPDHNIMTNGNSIKVIGQVDLNRILPPILDSGNRILSINCTEMGFEEYYLSLVGGKRHD